VRDSEISVGFEPMLYCWIWSRCWRGMSVVCEFAAPKRTCLSLSCERVGRERRASISLDLLRQDNEVIAGLRWSCFAILPPGFYSLRWAPFCEYEITTRSPWQLHAFVTLVGKKLAGAFTRSLLGGALLPAAAHVSLLRLAPLDLLYFVWLLGNANIRLPVNWSRCWN
jgi:hypothetical protein